MSFNSFPGERGPSQKDPYSLPGVPRGTGEDEVRKAYRKLAKELHPDVRPNDPAATERFKLATAAFNLLTDPAQRGRYDRGEIDMDGNEIPVWKRSRASSFDPFAQGREAVDQIFKDRSPRPESGKGPAGSDSSLFGGIQPGKITPMPGEKPADKNWMSDWIKKL